MRRDNEMKRGLLVLVSALAIGLAVGLGAQGRGSVEWTTSSLDAQRTGWLRNDARLTKEALQKNEFKFLWKAQFDNENRQLNSLTEPIILDRLIGFRGFKALAFLGGSADRLFAIDTDLGKPYWTTHIATPAFRAVSTSTIESPTSRVVSGPVFARLIRR